MAPVNKDDMPAARAQSIQGLIIGCGSTNRVLVQLRTECSLNSGTVTLDGEALAAGEWHDLALRRDGSVIAWGDDWNNECSGPASCTGLQVVAAGKGYSTAVTSNGTVDAWCTHWQAFRDIPAEATGVCAIAASQADVLALRTNGTIITWGYGYAVADVPPGLQGAFAIATGPENGGALLRTSPFLSDTDGDGIPDGQELEMGTSPVCSDSDHDGLSDGAELSLGTSPTNPDSDADGTPDGQEVINGSSPTSWDSDGDSFGDGY